MKSSLTMKVQVRLAHRDRRLLLLTPTLRRGSDSAITDFCREADVSATAPRGERGS